MAVGGYSSLPCSHSSLIQTRDECSKWAAALFAELAALIAGTTRRTKDGCGHLLLLLHNRLRGWRRRIGLEDGL